MIRVTKNKILAKLFLASSLYYFWFFEGCGAAAVDDLYNLDEQKYNAL